MNEHETDPRSWQIPPPYSISRRGFLKSSLAMLLAQPLLGCDDSPSEVVGPGPRLTARPGEPTIAPTLGLTALGLGEPRDGLLFVPESYSADTPVPLFVALHGAGGAGSDWAGYRPQAEGRGMVLLAPDSRSNTWDLIQGSYGPDVAFLDLALQYTFQRCRIDPTRIAFAGFSDGATYALSLGLPNGDLVSHIIAYSPGFFVRYQPVGMPRIFVSHGTNDTILPVTASRDTIVPSLRDAGYDVTYQEFDGGHQIPAAIAAASLDWFLDVG
jgi:phospholipase/carboxylesterase